MIYITGDTHGDIDIGKLSNRNWPDGRNLTDNDYLCILGDFGFPFWDKDIMIEQNYLGEYEFWTKWLSEKPYTILIIDGNHENFNFWDNLEVTEKWGGKVQHHPDIPNAYRLMRGEVYEIDSKTIFTFGGAVSIDKDDRIENLTWWAHEEATDDEMENARKNLEAHDHKVDYIFTHTMPMKIINSLDFIPISDKTAEFLDEIIDSTKYKAWCCGHFHMDEVKKKYKLRMCYDDIVPLEKCLSKRQKG